MKHSACHDPVIGHIGIYAYTMESLNKFCSYSESKLERYEKLEQLRALENGMTIGATEYLGTIPHGVDTNEDFEKISEAAEIF